MSKKPAKAKQGSLRRIGAAYVPRMTPPKLIEFRQRKGWDRGRLARELEISLSRIADYENDSTRAHRARPAPIPKVVELALRFLGHQLRPLSPEEKAALWRDVSKIPKTGGPPLTDDALRRGTLYDDRGW